MNKGQMNRRRQSGFSLVELLVVASIILIFTAIAVPVMDYGNKMNSAVREVSDVLELARTEAMAKNTWVWVGLLNQTPANGQAELLLAVVSSLDGSQNMNSSNLKPVIRVRKMPGVVLLSQLTDMAPTTGQPLTGSTYSFSATIGGTKVSLANSILGFTPTGEATLKPDETVNWLEVGLREKRGGKELPHRTASILVSGYSGQVTVKY